MVNQEQLQGSWNQVKGRLREKWGQLSDSDVATFGGDVDQLVGMIQRKTGETRKNIEAFLDNLSSEGGSFTARASDTVRQVSEGARQYANQALETVQENYSQVGDSVRHGYEEAEAMVHERPAESIAVAFGVGVLIGMMLTFSFRGNRA